MRIAKPLTKRQRRFIEKNRSKMAYDELADALNLKSVFKVVEFCMANNIKKTNVLTEKQMEYIRENHLALKESEIVKNLGITRFQLQNFKRSEGLAKYNANKERKKTERTMVTKGFFNVSGRENWVA